MYRAVLACLTLLASTIWAEAREANHLQGATSPYLLQHLYNPVDWYPWGPEALEKARTEDKPIFVSVGYSSCHWCHVMEDESFEDDAISALLNKHFVSIKIDRESRPDLDEQFMAVTQILTGTGGWPNSVFLTPDGDPFHAGGYFPPDMFLSVVNRVQQYWTQDPGFVSGEAARVSQAVSDYLLRKAEARDVTPDVVAQAVETVLEQMDPFNGGYGVAPKFPREPQFLFLLDQAARQGDAQALQAVTDMLDGMIKGGIHDHVGGGFHRYAVDPEWHVPHFEKMLYTQALTGRLLIRTWDITKAQRYRRAAERLFDYTLRELRDPAGGFYAAQDADSLTEAGERAEGAFYVWTPSDLTDLGYGANLVSDVFQVSPQGDLDGANILNMAALPSDLAADAGQGTQEFMIQLDGLLAEMLALRNARPHPLLDRKVVLSWNALMIATLAEAGFLLERPDYYRAAAQAASFILDQMQTPGGLTRVWFEGSPGIPAQLPDHAALGLALIALHDFAPDHSSGNRWLAHAKASADVIRNSFGTVEDGYRMTQTPDGISGYIQVDDVEIPSGNAMALALFARLTKRLQAPLIEQDGFRLAAALSGLAINIPAQRGSALKAIQELQTGETGRVRFAGSGAVRAAMTQTFDKITVDLTIADGWHVNAHDPLEDYLIATDLTVHGQLAHPIDYPAPTIKSLSFSDAPLALYEGGLRLEAHVSPGAVHQVDLTLQACSDRVCLQPETLTFVLWPPVQ